MYAYSLFGFSENVAICGFKVTLFFGWGCGQYKQNMCDIEGQEAWLVFCYGNKMGYWVSKVDQCLL